MASPEMIKRRKEAAPVDHNYVGVSQFQSEKMTQQSTPMTSKNHMFSSPAPSQSFARMQAHYNHTPAPGPFTMSERQNQAKLGGAYGNAGTNVASFTAPGASSIHYTDMKNHTKPLTIKAHRCESGAGAH